MKPGPHVSAGVVVAPGRSLQEVAPAPDAAYPTPVTLAGNQIARETATSEPSLSRTSPLAAGALDAAVLAELVDELGRVEVEELLTCLLEHARPTLSQLLAAEAAGDPTAAAAAAHSLVGAAGSLGATGLATALREVERVCRSAAPGRLTAMVREVEAAVRSFEAALGEWLVAR